MSTVNVLLVRANRKDSSIMLLKQGETVQTSELAPGEFERLIRIGAVTDDRLEADKAAEEADALEAAYTAARARADAAAALVSATGKKSA